MTEQIVRKTFVDSFVSPIVVDTRTDDYVQEGPVTEESVSKELEDRYYIAIPSRRSLLRTPELTAKREILMKLVYTGQISIDFMVAEPNSETSETCLVFYNTKPVI